MSKMNKHLSQLLNTIQEESEEKIESGDSSKTPSIPPLKEIVTTGDEKDLEEDYKVARENLRNSIEQNRSAIETLLALSNDSESPRAYEVLGQLMKINTELVRELLDNYKKMQDIKIQNNESNTPQNITNNTIFTGSSKELLELLNNVKNKNIDPIDIKKDEPQS